MDWEGKSFLSLGPDDESNGESAKREMFPKTMPRNQTAEQAKASAHARLAAESNAALAQLNAGLKVSQFCAVLRKVTEFRENKDEPEVASFMESLAKICDSVATTEKDVLFLVETVI